MRIVIDALCAEYGGIRTYVEHLLGGWSALYPEDEVHVVLRSGSTLATPGLHRHEIDVRSPDTLYRPLAQATAMHRLTRRIKPDVMLATAPTTDIRHPVAPLAVVILDLRAEILPHQFSRGRRALRFLSYGRSYQLASGFLAISQRSLDDLHRLHPKTRGRLGAVAHLGADHALTWPAPTRSGPAVAFAHHTNKNPELLIAAWAALVERRATIPDLTFLGVSAALRPGLEAQIAGHGLQDRITLARFLPDEEFHRVFTQASLVAFPSDFEGFGLPIVEGMVLGKPVVIGPDPGCLEVAGGHAAVMKDWTSDALAHAVESALAQSPDQREQAMTWAATFTWSRTIVTIHDALARLARQLDGPTPTQDGSSAR